LDLKGIDLEKGEHMTPEFLKVGKRIAWILTICYVKL
jgi:hypothetical protein